MIVPKLDDVRARLEVALMVAGLYCLVIGLCFLLAGVALAGIGYALAWLSDLHRL